MLHETLLTDWESDQVNQIRLAQLLDDPVLRKALNIVRSAHRAEANEVTFKEPASAAHAFHFAAGATSALDAIFKLSIPQRENKQKLPHAGWGDIKTSTADSAK